MEKLVRNDNGAAISVQYDVKYLFHRRKNLMFVYQAYLFGQTEAKYQFLRVVYNEEG